VGDSFAKTAVRLAGMTGVLLGWRPDDFWRATPAELASVLAAMSPPGGAPPDPDDMKRLREQFPDG